MGKIQKLETLTALQIAAGEVIDRPAAVVREILENSIDAGASQIKIELFSGGVQKIILTDEFPHFRSLLRNSFKCGSNILINAKA